MKYIMKSGVLYDAATLSQLARIKFSLSENEKKILGADPEAVWKTGIRSNSSSDNGLQREYTLAAPDGKLVLTARPEMTAGNAFEPYGLKKIECADVWMETGSYHLNARNSRCYALMQEDGTEAVLIEHRGIAGGWTITDALDLAPEILTAIFVFSKYMERENELILV